MKHLKEFNSFYINEQETLKLIEDLSLYLTEDINEGIKDWFKKIGDFFEKVNDSIKNLMISMLEMGIKSLNLIKSFFAKIFEKIKLFKEKYPVIYRIVITTLVLIVLAFVLCSAASSHDKTPPEGVINAAIGLLKEIKDHGSSSNVDDSVLLKAQAYLFELKKTGTELKVGDEAVKAAQSAIKIIQQDIQEYKLSGDKNPSDAEYLVKLAEQGAKLVSYKITEYSNKLTGEYSGENISLGYK